MALAGDRCAGPTSAGPILEDFDSTVSQVMVAACGGQGLAAELQIRTGLEDLVSLVELAASLRYEELGACAEKRWQRNADAQARKQELYLGAARKCDQTLVQGLEEREARLAQREALIQAQEAAVGEQQQSCLARDRDGEERRASRERALADREAFATRRDEDLARAAAALAERERSAETREAHGSAELKSARAGLAEKEVTAAKQRELTVAAEARAAEERQQAAAESETSRRELASREAAARIAEQKLAERERAHQHAAELAAQRLEERERELRRRELAAARADEEQAARAVEVAEEMARTRKPQGTTVLHSAGDVEGPAQRMQKAASQSETVAVASLATKSVRLPDHWAKLLSANDSGEGRDPRASDRAQSARGEPAAAMAGADADVRETLQVPTSVRAHSLERGVATSNLGPRQVAEVSAARSSAAIDVPVQVVSSSALHMNDDPADGRRKRLTARKRCSAPPGSFVNAAASGFEPSGSEAQDAMAPQPKRQAVSNHTLRSSLGESLSRLTTPLVSVLRTTGQAGAFPAVRAVPGTMSAR